ncbi:MAG: thiamine pyrophosphate-dependent enzyme [Thermoplasmata archaeon]
MTVASEIVPLPYQPEDVRTVLGPDWEARVRSAYRWMILGRTLDTRMTALQRQGRVGFYGAATGQEAVNVGAGLTTLPEDWVFPGLREQLIALVRGHPLVEYASHLFATDLDPARGRQMPCHPTAHPVRYVSMSSVIGTQISQAVGTAYAIKHKRAPGVSVAFFGDGATSANDFHSGLNFAAVWEVPIVFCCTNNQWAISNPVSNQTHVATLAEKSREYGMPGQRVDGTDLVAVIGSLRAALERARGGAGPTFLEYVVYRMTAHSTSDDPKRYQPADWAAQAEAHDPVRRLELWLAENGLVAESERRVIATEVDDQVRAAIAVAESQPPPDPASLLEDVLAAPAPPSGVGTGG